MSSVASLAGIGVLASVQYRLELDGGDSGNWRIRQLEINEGVSELYECVLDLANDQIGADVASLQGTSCAVLIERDTQVRRLCGIITRVEWRGRKLDEIHVRVHVEPALAALAQIRDCRIFQEMSVKDVLTTVLTEGLADYDRKPNLKLDRAYEAREYCTQYNESNLEFAVRLMSEEGIFFFFDHSGKKEELVLVDTSKKCPPYESTHGDPVPIAASVSSRRALRVETIERLDVETRMQSTGVVLRDFDWTRPRLDLTCPQSKPGGVQRTVFEYPSPQVISGYDVGQKKFTREEAKIRVELRKEELGARTWFCTGESNVTGLAPGHVLEVGGEVEPQHEEKYLIIRVEHHGRAAEMRLNDTQDAADDREPYRNRFTCIPFDTPYRPPQVKPVVVHGPQTATVVGPAGEEIHTDEHGRIKVQFHWDRQGQKDDHSSCFVRVAQGLAGAGWGFVFLPRIGMEVVVQFLEGNPDRPLVTGCVYNGDHSPPYNLPVEKTVSTIKSLSSPGGNGSNEIKFEDAAGSEELFIHAQKDMTSVVENDETATVGANRTATVKKDESTTVEGAQTNTVKGTRTTTVTGKDTQTFEDSREVKVSANDSLTVESGTRTIDVKGKVTETFQGGRGTTINQGDTLTVEGSNKNDTIHGEYSITADTHFKVTQKGDEFLLCDAATLRSVGDITLKNSQCEIVAHNDGMLSITAATEIKLTCGSSCLTMKSDGTIDINGSTKVNVGSGNSTLTLEPSSATLNSEAITSIATGLHDLQGAVVKVNA